MLAIEFASDAIRFIKKMPAKHARQVSEKIADLRHTPYGHDSIELKGYDALYRADSGEYRIIYRVKEDCLYVLMVGKRNDDAIYKQLKRKYH